MGVHEPPGSVTAAVDAYLAAREDLEERFGVTVPRELERAVSPVVVGV
jgi:hypothetical protein